MVRRRGARSVNQSSRDRTRSAATTRLAHRLSLAGTGRGLSSERRTFYCRASSEANRQMFAGCEQQAAEGAAMRDNAN